MKKLAVIAFGGNALLRGGQKGTCEEQMQNVADTCQSLLPFLKQGYNLVIGHGNGPQVGNVLLQNAAGEKLGIPAMPMDVCGAETQGQIGYMIEMGLEKVTAETGAVYKEDPKGKGWRKVVASPKPIDIQNVALVKRLAEEGNIVITVGGGGIPVIKKDGVHVGVEAVIDKDLASAMTAIKIGADEFYILTDVPKVYINFRKENEKALDTITVAEAKQYLEAGHFTEGSMAPKIRAAILFVEATGHEAIITEATKLGDPTCGTRIVA